MFTITILIGLAVLVAVILWAISRRRAPGSPIRSARRLLRVFGYGTARGRRYRRDERCDVAAIEAFNFCRVR